jgi:hypothetical protein
MYLRQEATMSKTEIKRFTADTLLALKLPEPRWAIPGILPQGLAILGAKPKMGKSTLALNISIAISTGGMALGQIKVEKGSVLYLALEDTQRRLQDRIKKMIGASTSAPKDLHLCTEWPRMDSGGIVCLEEELKEIPDLRLVVIDTFAMVRPAPKGGSANVYALDYKETSDIKKLADQNKTTILLVHHFRKSKSEDVFEMISGSSGLTGAADTLLAMDNSSGHANAILCVKGRDVEMDEYAMVLDPSTMSWTLVGHAEEIQSTCRKQKVYDALRDSHKALGPAELAEMTNLDYKYIQKTLASLVEDGAVSRIDRGEYLYIGDNRDKDGNGDIGDKGDIVVPDMSPVH